MLSAQHSARGEARGADSSIQRASDYEGADESTLVEPDRSAEFRSWQAHAGWLMNGSPHIASRARLSSCGGQSRLGMTGGHIWGSALSTGEQQESRASETEAAMQTDGGEHGRRQDSLAVRVQAAAVAGDGGHGTEVT